MNNLSKLEQLKLLPQEQQQAYLSSLDENTAQDLLHDIKFIGRPKQQLPDGDWTSWLILAGRGFGKTFVGAHTVINWARNNPGCRIALIGETVADVRDVMIRGDSGILKQSHPAFMPTYNPSNRIITFPNGSIGQTFSGEEPEQMRGPQFHYAWVDELAKMRYQNDVWDMLSFCMRLGDHPRVLVTTTPRPTKLIREIYTDETTHTTEGSTYENSNLPKVFLDKLRKKYEGTRLGEQELYAKILDDNPNSLFRTQDIEIPRLRPSPSGVNEIAESMDRIVVAIDPAGTSNENSDETGIVVAGKKGDKGYIFADGSVIETPKGWAKEAIQLYEQFRADRVVAEVNFGADMVESVVRSVDEDIAYKSVRATKGKKLRAEPIASLYEQHRIVHVGYFDKLEEQMIQFDPSMGRNQDSPDRMDALVWALTELFGNDIVEPVIWSV